MQLSQGYPEFWWNNYCKEIHTSSIGYQVNDFFSGTQTKLAGDAGQGPGYTQSLSGLWLYILPEIDGSWMLIKSTTNGLE